MTYTPGGPGATEYTGLTDTPANFTGKAGQHPVVNVGESGLEFEAPPAIPAIPDEFLDLIDTPATFTGHGSKTVAVNVGESALEFITPVTGVTTFTALTDTPANFTGQTLKAVRVNVGETALEYYTPAGASTAKQFMVVALSDETTSIGAIATDVMTFRMPAGILTSTPLGVRISLNSATTTGLVTVDINVNGATILSTKLTIDATEKTSVTAATPAVISAATITDDDIISVDIDGIGDGTANGLKLTLIYEDNL